MKRISILLLAAAAATPALAQHSGHAAPATPPPPPSSTCTPEHAAMGHCRMPAPATVPAPAPAVACTPEHAAMGHCRLPQPSPPAPPPPPACTAEHAAMGHCRLPEPASTTPPAAAAQADSQPASHAAHDAPSAPDLPAPPAAPPPSAARSGPAHAADAVFGAEAMAAAREALSESHGGLPTWRAGVDQLELALSDGRGAYAWEDLHLRYGGDIDRLWIKSAGEGEFGGPLERAEVQALWSRAISPFFDLQAGARYDFRPDPERAWLVLGVQGLAPYWFEVDGALFLSHRGEVTARFEGEYDQRITQRFILQPRVELDLAFQDVPELGIGAGLSSGEAGLRLRYEIVPEFAPYVGIQYERAFGDSASFARAAGESAGGWSVLFGVRAWF